MHPSASALALRLLPLALLPAALSAQATARLRPAPTSIVSGHVFCADTNLPARLAKVVLEPADAVDNQHPEKPPSSASDPNADPAVLMTGVQTLPDGSFSIHSVTAGAYYVMVTMPGYVSPFAALGLSEEEVAKLDDEAKKRIIKTVPRVTVEAGLPASIDISLERGAAVSGTISYDDGSPASDLQVQVLIKNTKNGKDKWAPPSTNTLSVFGSRFTTDDRGSYRISGLPAHEYLMQVELAIAGPTQYSISRHGSSTSSAAQNDTLFFFSGSSANRKDAKPFTLELGEERAGEDIRIPLSKLHTITGNLVSARDGHIINAGTILLLRADDKSQVADATLSAEDTGFAFHFVSEGDYLLQVSGAADVEYVEIPEPSGSFPPTRSESHTLHSYDLSEQPLPVSADMTGITIAVPEKSAKKTSAAP